MCLVARPSNVGRREHAKAGETKPSKVIMSSLSFPHRRDRLAAGGAMWQLPRRLCAACTHPRLSTSVCFPCPKPAYQQQLGRDGAQNSPLGMYGWGGGLGMQSWVQPVPTVLIHSPSWWVVKLLSQLFPVQNPHEEAGHYDA